MTLEIKTDSNTQTVPQNYTPDVTGRDNRNRVVIRVPAVSSVEIATILSDLNTNVNDQAAFNRTMIRALQLTLPILQQQDTFNKQLVQAGVKLSNEVTLIKKNAQETQNKVTDLETNLSKSNEKIKTLEEDNNRLTTEVDNLKASLGPIIVGGILSTGAALVGLL